MINCRAIEKLRTKQVYSIEGNIGAGKTTVLNILGKSLKDVYFVEEPVKEWQNIGGMNLLEKFYSDSERWGFSFEFYVMLSKLKALTKAAESTKSIIILERSLLSNKVFMDISFKLEKLNDLEYKMLKNTWEFYMNNVYPILSGVLYLNTSVDVCVSRIAKRNRQEESSVDAGYLRLIHEHLEKNISELKIPILVINGDFDLDRDVLKMTTGINDFMENKQSITI